MKRVFLNGDGRLMWAGGDAGWALFDLFVDGTGHVVAFTEDDPRHPDRIEERLEREAELASDPASEDHADAVIGGRASR